MSYYNKKKHIKLKKINFSFNVHINNASFNSLIPLNAKEWVNKQLNYYFNNNNKLDCELFTLMINYSMKIFNYIIDQHTVNKNDLSKAIIFWKKIKLDKYDAINHVINYINNSPSCDTQLSLYSGISYDFFKIISFNSSYVSQRFLSTTFDKFHALNYAHTRKKNKEKVLYLLKIKTNLSVKCVYSFYENQVVFPPNVTIRITDTKIKYNFYKDILDNELSKKIYPVIIINCVFS